MKTDLSKFNIGDYKSGNKTKVFIWFFINYYILNSSFPWPYRLKVFFLRLFGAKIGFGLIIKNKVRIKNPWRLVIGDHCWLGESVWIDNLENVSIGNNVCISQGAMLLTGNHDYTKSSFPYRLGRIEIEDGVWIGAKSVVCPGVICRSHSILTVSSVATKELNNRGIYSGNPAVFVRNREIKE
ncbi:MAG TPA: WcaF family extracellular polysaccharide biosynthesis acetyltransferase [Mucilaginibacter sp.]|jgi:putative colanic acid biosynthesis acetyltransferase WcaF